MTQSAALCSRCGTPLAQGALYCPQCGTLVYERELKDLAARAQATEATDPRAAADLWRQCLPLLPPNSQPYVDLSQRIATLSSGGAPVSFQVGGQNPPRPPVKSDPLSVALFKTIGSMVISIAIYASVWQMDWQLASGFVLLILVHEMGHVAALRYYGYSASPPIFIPFVGAIINLRQPPRNAWEEAIIGIGGPVTGAIAAFACYAMWIKHPESELWLILSYFGFLLNFFNMIPIPPLDGGRVTAAVSPWAWIAGLGTIGLWFIYQFIVYQRLSWIMILIIIFAFPRIRQTLQSRALRNTPYYAIGRRANWTMGIAYLALTILLAVFYFKTQHYMQRTI
jgi:Zn-dependent protease